MYRKLLTKIVFVVALVPHIEGIPSGLCSRSNDRLTLECNGLRLSVAACCQNNKEKLKTVLIYDCKVKIIPDNVLPYYNLEHLQISCNIDDISSGAFSRFSFLKVLDLTENNLSALPSEVFQSLPSLEKLDLSLNNFASIQPDIFNDLSNLNELNMSYNQINSLSNGLNALGKLEKLYLNNNKIDFISLSVFQTLSKLTTLDLSNNNVKHFPASLFTFTMALKYLNISNNAIEEFPMNIFQQTPLKVLDVSYNSLKKLQIEVYHPQTLTELNVSNNEISRIVLNSQNTNKFQLRTLNLRENRLVYLDDNFLSRASNLQTLKIDANPWECKCLDKILIILGGDLSDYTSFDYHQGRKPICVTGALTECVIDDNNLVAYYEMYSGPEDGECKWDICPRNL